jgi:phytoene dehydrogenase-like protein
MAERFDVVVVGAGLAGLTAAVSAAGEGRRVALLDGRRAGGRAMTSDHGTVRFNQGPHALFRGGAGWAVLQGLGIEPAGEPPSADIHGLRHGALHPLPRRAGALARTHLLRPRSRVQAARLLSGLARIDPATVAGRSAATWFDELGLHPDTRDLITMLARTSTYVGEMEHLAADIALRQLQASLASGVRYLHGGWQQLVDALADLARRREVVTRTDDPVVTVRPRAGSWWISTAAGRQLDAPAVVVAAGSPANAATLLGGEAPWGRVGSDVTAACLDVASRRAATPPVVFGVGEPLYLSTHCPPAALAPDGTTVIAVMRYRGIGEQGDPTADRAQLRRLRTLVGIGDADVVHERYLHRITVVHGLPPIDGGLAGRPPVAVDDADGLYLAGDWVGPAGWLADASLASGEAAGLLAASRAHLTRAG